MDIGSAQWTLQHVGRLNRIDLSLSAGTSAQAFRARLEEPPARGNAWPSRRRSSATAPSRSPAPTASISTCWRWCRLLTGAFLVFSTQSLSVLRRRSVARPDAGARSDPRPDRGCAASARARSSDWRARSSASSSASRSRRRRCDSLSGDLGNGQLHAQGAVARHRRRRRFARFPGHRHGRVGLRRLAAGARGIRANPPHRRSRAAMRARGGQRDHADRSAAPRCSIAGAALAWLPPLGGHPGLRIRRHRRIAVRRGACRCRC